MVDANRRKIGKGAHGKLSGSGAMTDLPPGMLGENTVLDNRRKAQHTRERGQDSHRVRTEQYQDNAASREIPVEDLSPPPKPPAPARRGRRPA